MSTTYVTGQKIRVDHTCGLSRDNNYHDHWWDDDVILTVTKDETTTVPCVSDGFTNGILSEYCFERVTNDGETPTKQAINESEKIMTKHYKVIAENMLYVEGAILEADSSNAWPINNMFNTVEELTDTQYISVKIVAANPEVFERVYKFTNEAGKTVYGSRQDAIDSLKA